MQETGEVMRWNVMAMVAAVTAATSVGITAAAAAPAVRPTPAAVAAVLARAEEVGTPSEHLRQWGQAVTVSDGSGGWLTAVPAVRYPTADGYGQYVLFWHDTTFVGSDNLTPLPNLGPEAVSLRIAATGPDRITVRFARYRKTDPMTHPSLPPGYVTYRWARGRLVASGPVPSGAGNGLRMVIAPLEPRIVFAYLPKGAVAEGVAASVGVENTPRGWTLTWLEFSGGPGFLVRESPAAAQSSTRPRAAGAFSMGADGTSITFLFPYPAGRWAHRRVRFVFVYRTPSGPRTVTSAPFVFPS
jgi:hypothetical protein